jgi:uridine kinase
VAVDGVDGAGKTVFADELAGLLRQRGVSVVRASADGFHHPPEVRYRRGRRSPEGFFLDSYDYAALRRLLLEPLLEDGDRQIVRQIYDVHAETPVDRVVESVADVEALVFDGVFAHRPELRDFWDHSVFLEVSFEVSIPRGARRGYGDPDPAADANRRYLEGQHLYLATCHPQRHARWVVDNNVLEDAHVIERAEH